MRRSVGMGVLGGIVVVVVSGCPSRPAATPSTEATPPAPTAPVAATPAAPGQFAWTEAPAVAQIPEGEIKGMVNGKEFTARTVLVEKDEAQATLVLSDAATEKPTDMIMGDTGIDLDFTLPEGKPGELVLDLKADKDFDKEHAYYHYPQGGDKGPMSVNPEWAVALSITEWSMEPDPANPDVIGKVKGKVAVVFGDDAKSWVAGTFEAPYVK